MIALALLVLCGATAAEEVDLTFAPREGLRLAKTCILSREMSLVELGTAREGVPLVREQVGGWLVSGTRQSWIDEYLEVAGGRPEFFRRTWNSYVGNAHLVLTGSRTSDQTARFVSDLAGLAVLHTWVPEEGTWGRCYDGVFGDEDYLEVLEDDADFLGFLPPGPVAVGASWTADPEALRSLLTPGGNSSATPEKDGYFERMVEVGLGGDLADVLGKTLDGTLEVSLAEVREEQGHRLAVLSAAFSVRTERDRTLAYLKGMPKEERREPAELQQVLVTWSADGTAEILWDLDAGHVAGASGTADEQIVAEVHKLSAAQLGVPTKVSQRSSYSGELELQLKVRDADTAPDEDEPADLPVRRKKRNRDG